MKALLLNAATRLSATIDEPFHITSGYEYLRTGNVRLFDEHPPLAKALFAWPLFFVPDLAPPETANGYADGALITVAQETLLAYRPLDRVIVAPRIAAALLTVLLAATIYRVAATLAGPPPGVLALALCALDPNFLAHGSLATTDMGATAFSLWALWAGTRWLQRPTRRRWGIAALLLGLAQVVRLTALVLYPVLVRTAKFPPYQQRDWVNVTRHKFSGLVGHDRIWCLYCDWMTGVWSMGGEMLRNVESFWCPIRFRSDLKCANCRHDFPDIDDGWVDANSTIVEASKKLEEMYVTEPRPPTNAWFGHPVRMTVKGKPIDGA